MTKCDATRLIFNDFDIAHTTLEQYDKHHEDILTRVSLIIHKKKDNINAKI